MIKLKNIEKSFGNHVILRDVNMEIASRSKVALLGPNGTGKTTLLRILVGLIKPTRGTVQYSNLNNSPKTLMNDIRLLTSFVPDNPFFFEYLTGRENLQFHANVYKYPEGLNRGIAMCRQLGIIEIDNPVGSYSRGTRQKLALVRAIMVEPMFLIMDEPFNTLDPYAVDVMKQYLISLEDSIIVASSHVMSVLEGFADMVAVLKGGNLIHYDTFSVTDMKQNISLWFGHELEE